MVKANRSRKKTNHLPAGPHGPAQIHCQVQGEARKVVSLGKDMLRALRRLKRRLAACRGCAQEPGCPILESFHEQVNTAILEVTEEWGWGDLEAQND